MNFLKKKRNAIVIYTLITIICMIVVISCGITGSEAILLEKEFTIQNLFKNMSITLIYLGLIFVVSIPLLLVVVYWFHKTKKDDETNLSKLAIKLAFIAGLGEAFTIGGLQYLSKVIPIQEIGQNCIGIACAFGLTVWFILWPKDNYTKE